MFLLRFGFAQSKANPSLFIYHQKNLKLYLLLYVDDIILTGSHAKFITHFVDQLGREFDVKDLGSLRYFIGLEVNPHSEGLHISQVKYTLDLLHCHSMTECKPCSTSLAASVKLSANEGDLLVNATEYRHLVGSL
ncbi:hypothetical protein LWI29_004695 [Acer saccharum]|uniref:Reverse transcriptase Ty1/copia-type domain-containing protein n=1 Tax=Acer saccharum TaxID=4024 RepID=A0AA39TDG9_ACESA|nr:hypothetical protein LWI29_004695 [Acer saccharum]